MEYESYEKGHFHIINIKEALNLTSQIDELEKVVNALLEQNRTNIAIHFANESCLCSSSGTVLIHCWENIKDHGGTLALININQEIRDFLNIIDFDSLIKICKSEAELKEIL